jgi:rhodanese-related sulfurtransferase
MACRLRYEAATKEGSFLMYRGDLPPAEVFDRLKANANAVLIDVRTQPEWTFVGLPQVDRLVRVAWQVYPMMDINAKFVDDVKAMGLAPDTEIFLICRSGARSASAATALTNAGFTNCWNVAQGFEGAKDASGHRSNTNGWKYAGLPWTQS